MEIINNIEYFFDDPKNAITQDKKKKLTKKQLKTVIFDDSVKENIKFCFPLNDQFSFTETRELQRPISVEQLLKFIRDFYHEPIKSENIDKAFEDNEEWKDEILEKYDGDISKIINYDVFDLNNVCSPDFCGLGTESFEETGEYFICIGPE